jgi:hypothetical protein
VPASRSIVASLAVFLVVASMLPASALGPPHPAILDPVARELGAPPVDAVAVDVVGDAQQDLVVTVTGSDTPGAGGSLLVFQRLAGGGLAQVPTEHDVPDESPGLELAVGDLDDDGDEDLVVSGESSLKVFLQAGAGLPATPSFSASLSVGRWPVSPVVADLDDDGLDDVAYVEEKADRPYRVVGRLQLAGGGLGAAMSVFSTDDSIIVAGDVNNDGRDDLVVQTGTPPMVALLQDGSGGFTESSISSDGVGLGGLLVGDVTGDGLVDLVVHTVFPSGKVQILEGMANGLPEPGASATISENTRGLAAGDFNGDGITDLATGAETSDTIAVLQADDGGLHASCAYDLTGGVVFAADLTGSALPDLVTLYSGWSVVNVYPVQAASSQMDAEMTFDVVPEAEAGEEVQLGGRVSFPLGGCLDDDASVEITRTLPGGAPEVLAVVGLESIAAHEWTFTTTDVAPALEGDVEYTASFGGDTLHAPADAPSRVVSVTKRESILTLQAKPRSITVGQRSTLTAGLDGGASRTVIFYEGEGVGRVEIGRVEADDAGLARVQVRPTTHTTYSAAYEGDSGSTAADSPAREVGVAALVKGAMKRYASKEGKYAIYRSSQRIFYSTSAKPKKPGDRVTIHLEYRRGGWASGGSQSFTLGPTGAVTIYLRAKGLPSGTSFRFYTSWRGDSTNFGASSKPSYFRVR